MTSMEDNDDSRIIFSNLEESDPQEAYILCRAADDPTGHKARQAFREEAASKRGKDSIYFYMKDLVRQHGTSEKKQGEKYFNETSFRAFITTIPSLDASLSDEEKTALFYKIDHRRTGILTLEDLVYFSLLDKYQMHALVIKYWIYLHRQRLTDTELRETFNRMLKTEGPDTDSVCLDLLHAALTREFDVSLTSGELQMFKSMIDLDGDGFIRYQDFTGFYALRYKTVEELLKVEERPIVEIEVSLSEKDEVEHRRNGFSQVPINIHDHTNGKPTFLWYKRAAGRNSASDVRPAVTKLKFSKSSRDTALLTSGFTCLMKDINRSGTLAKALYIWMRHSTSLSESLQDGIIDITLTTGSEKDPNHASLTMPPCRGFIRIDGDLNERSTKYNTYLWVRTRNELIETSLITTPRPNTSVVTAASSNYSLRQKASSIMTRGGAAASSEHPQDLILSPSAAKNVEEKFSSVEQLESQVRTILRRKCPLDRSHCLDFARFFNEFDTKKYGYLSKTVVKQSLASLGLKMQNKDYDIFWRHIDTDQRGKLRMESFVQFLRLTDAGIDEISQHVQRALSDAMKQGVDYSERFREFNANGDGKLSRSDFQRLLASVQIRVSPEVGGLMAPDCIISHHEQELSRLIERFDLNQDGVVDYVDFLRFITGICDDATREATRVAAAAEEFHMWAVEVQNKKVAKEGNIDSTAAWKALKPKDGVIPHAHIDKILRTRQVRLTPRELAKLAVIIAPLKNGRIDQKSLHRFVNHKPKKISQLLANLKQLYTALEGSDEALLQALDVEHDGTLDLPTLQGVLKELAVDVGVEKIDIKDLVYVVQYTGCDIGADGTILLDRFVFGICGNADRRNMKYDFVTASDSIGFLDGVTALRAEIHRTAKTPDGKYDYRLPFREFDADDTGTIALSEFEKKIKELEIEKYMTESDIKTLLRRFDVNEKGGIDYTEFRRFASEPAVHPKQSSFASSTKQINDTGSSSSMLSDIHRIFQHLHHDIVESHDRVMKHVETAFAQHDPDRTGRVSASKFQSVLKELVAPNRISKPDESRLVRYLSPSSRTDEPIDYRDFIAHLFQHSRANAPKDPAQTSKFLRTLHQEIAQVSNAFDFRRAFEKFDPSRLGTISRADLQDILLMAGVMVEDDFSSVRGDDILLDAFDTTQSGSIDYLEFLKYIKDGPEQILRSLDIPVATETPPRGQIDAVLAQLQFEIQQMASKAGDQTPNFSKVFSVFDTNDDGYISASEFIRVLGKFGLAKDIIERRQHSMLLDFFDTDKDGRINYNEFCSFAKNADKRIMARLKGESDDVATVVESSRPDAAEISKILSKIAHSAAAGRFNFKQAFERQKRRSNTRASKDAIFETDFKRVVRKFRADTCPRLAVKEIKRLTVYYALRDNPALVRYIDFCDAIGALSTRHHQPVTNEPRTQIYDSAASETSSNYSESSSSSDGNLSSDTSSSDDNKAYIEKLFRRVLRASFASERKLRKLEQKITTRRAAKAETMENVSERRIRRRIRSFYKLHLPSSELDNLLHFLKAPSKRGGKPRYSIKRFESLLLEAIHDKSSEQDTPQPSQQQSFLRSLYESLVEAARRNFHCLKMFERCDPDNTGKISIDEFKVVMKLIGCPLSNSQVDQIKRAINKQNRNNYRGHSSFYEIDYRAFYETMEKTGEGYIQNAPPYYQTAGRSMYNPAAASPYLQTTRVSPAHRSQRSPPPPPPDTRYGREFVAAAPCGRGDDDDDDALREYIRARISPLCLQRYGPNHEYLPLFLRHDFRKTGYIDAALFHRIITGDLGVVLPHDSFSALLRRFCMWENPRDTLVDYNSFCKWLRVRSPRMAAVTRETSDKITKVKTRFDALRREGIEIWDTYAMFDLKRTGEISQHEFREASRQLGLPLTTDELQTVAQSYLGGRGVVLYKKFLNDSGIRESVVASDECILSPSRQIVTKPVSSRPWTDRVSTPPPSKAQSGWKCTVCYHQQEKPASNQCEICGSPNPSQQGGKVKAITQCCVCAFRNQSNAKTCTMCGTCLPVVNIGNSNLVRPVLETHRTSSTGWLT